MRSSLQETLVKVNNNIGNIVVILGAELNRAMITVRGRREAGPADAAQRALLPGQGV